METKPLLYGIIGFILGGLLVSVAATTINKPATDTATSMSMDQMVSSLRGKQGDDYDKAFLAEMIEHHQGAVAMAKLSSANAKHQEIKNLSTQIIAAQQQEITSMQSWQQQWGYRASTSTMHMNQ